MISFLREHQTNIMIGLSSICAIIALFTLITKTIRKRRKIILMTMEICSSVWLFADRIAYIYHGVAGKVGFYQVRISNFLVFSMTVMVLGSINLYLEDVLVNEGGLKNVPFVLRISELLAILAFVLVIISQFTGLYYTFDATNTYQRSKFYFISYLFPYSILIIMLVVLIVNRKRLKGKIGFSLFLFVVGCIASSMLQLFYYGVSWMDMMAVILVIMVYMFALLDLNERVERANRIAIDHLKNEQESMKRLFDQTANVLAVAIDAKDPRTQGRSGRVAEYAKEIARVAGLDEKECDNIYYSALLHDVGKVRFPDTLVSRENGLEGDDSTTLKMHTEAGVELLSGITEYPFLKDGARAHHERFDGQGYPEGLKGDEIPVAARIVAIADYYDEMTSKRVFKDPLPQRTVREEILKESGITFDPDYVKAMVELIDADTGYQMREHEGDDASREVTDITNGTEVHFGEYKDAVSDGIRLSENITKMRLSVRADKGVEEKDAIPALILFDSYDGCTHSDDMSIRALNYLEYAEIWLDGHTVDNAARNIEVSEIPAGGPEGFETDREGVKIYEIESAKYKDHVRLVIRSREYSFSVVAALTDSARFAYMGITGEHCSIRCLSCEETGETVKEGDIKRIAEEVSFIDRIEGDIPNVQIESYRKAWTEPTPLADGLRIAFHTMSLPTANLIWHCPFILLYSSDDGKPDGTGYKEIACIRLDGENATFNGVAHNDTLVYRGEDFVSWDEWKKVNKRGYECEVDFRRRRNRILTATDNCGIRVRNTTTITDKTENIYVVITGDQCAITDIRVKQQ